MSIRRGVLFGMSLLLAGAGAVPFFLSQAQRWGEIIVVVFVDLDGNGVRDEGEPGFPGLPVLVEGGREAITDDGGRAFFPNVPPTSITVSLSPEAVQVVRDHGLRLGRTVARLTPKGGARSELAFVLKPEGFLTVDVTELAPGAPLGAQDLGSARELTPSTGTQDAKAVRIEEALGCGHWVQED